MLRDATEKALRWSILAALVSHAAVVAAGSWDELAAWLNGKELGDLDGEVIIPIDLDLEGGPSLEGDKLGTDKSDPPKVEKAAGQHGDAPPATAAPPPPPPPSATASASASTPPPAPPPAGPKVKEPVAAAGGPGSFAKDPNVQVLFYCDVLRKHETAADFGRVLRAIPEWNGFFGGIDVDPVRDFDHFLLAAPRLREDSSKAVVVLDYRLKDAEMKKAVEAVVAGAKGKVVEGAQVPTWKATIQGAERLFSLVENKNLVAILPAEAEAQLGKLQKTKGFSSSGKTAIAISLVTPSRALGEVFPMPKTIAWLRLNVSPAPDGAADVVLELEDKSEELAAKNAEALEKQLDKMRFVSVPGLSLFTGKIEAIDHVDFTSEGKYVRGKARLSRQQLSRILSFAEYVLKKRAGK